MKLVVFGLSVSSAWGNGHATLWRGILRALAASGHEVVFFERDTPFYAKHRDLPVGDGYEIVVYPSWDAVRGRADDALRSADVAIVTSYQADALAAAAAVDAAPCCCARVFYDLDTPVTLDLLDRGEVVPWLPPGGLGAFDLVLSFTGGRSLDALVQRLGARRVAPLYGCVDTRTHHPVPPRPEWTCDLSYLGTYAADRQDAVDRLFLDVAERQPARWFLLGGPMYPDGMRRPANALFIPHVEPADHPAFYGSSRMTLNLTRGAMKTVGFCPSARLFEAAACGTPIVSDAWEGLETFFEPGRELLVASTTDDALAALALPPAALADLARRARERTLAEHTAERRAAELVRHLDSIPARRPGASAA
jgi:spore maturation protein CgeB